VGGEFRPEASSDGWLRLSLAAAIRIRNGDLGGALTVPHEAAAQQHADGNRMGLGITLQRSAAVLARLDQAEPAAVLAGAVSAHFAVATANVPQQERVEIDQAHALTRRMLGEAAYSKALRWTTINPPVTRWASSGDSSITRYRSDGRRNE
jgi:hypothetical protein